MASWSTTTKHEPTEINGGQKYELGDQVSLEQLNAITENTFSTANKDLSNVTYPQVIANGVAQTGAGDRVIESKIYSDGMTWYRKWASGWKECGLILNGGSNITKQLPITFVSAQYTICGSMVDGDTGASTSLIVIERKIDSIKYSLTWSAGGSSGTLSSNEHFTCYCCGY